MIEDQGIEVVGRDENLCENSNLKIRENIFVERTNQVEEWNRAGVVFFQTQESRISSTVQP